MNGSDMKRLFYVWFLGARECRGLRGDEFVRPIVRYFQRKEEECEPSKVTLQISAKGIKLVAESLRHFVPSHAVTYVSQGAPPDDDIVSVILLLYNPITKCPVHLHAYRCDSVETADLLAEQLQLLVDMPENQRKISELEQRLQSQGLYPNASGQLLAQSRMLIKSCDTGLGGSNGDLLADSSSSSEDAGGLGADSHHFAHHQRPPVPLNASGDPTVPKSDQERIARLYDSLAAELRDKLGGALSGKAGPILLPPRDYEQPQQPPPSANNKSYTAKGSRALQGKHIVAGENNNSSSSGPSSGIGSDLDDHPPKNHRDVMRPAAKMDVISPHPRQRYSYHEPQQQQSDVVRRRDPVVRQLSERREATLMNRRSMSDLRHRQEESNPTVTLRRREESCRDVRDFQQVQQHHSAMYPEGGRSRVKEALSKFEQQQQQQPTVSAASRSRSFREGPDPSSLAWNSSSSKYRRQQHQVPYQELDQRERFPGLDRETARILDPMQQPQHQQRNLQLQRHKSSEFTSMIKRSSAFNVEQATASLVVVEPTQKVGNRHFRAIRQPN